MKIRNGFVSNSSSSSYIIAGISVSSKEEMKNKFKIPDDKYEEIDNNDAWSEGIDGFDVAHDYENELFYVGEHISTSDGFWGGESYDVQEFVNAMNSDNVKRLKDMGENPKIIIVQIE